MSNIPVREMIGNAVKDLGGKATYRQIIDWVKTKYGDVNEGTIRCQTIACSVNQPSRVHYPENNKTRDSDFRYDQFYSTGRGEVELFDVKKHGSWGIKERDGKSSIITHEGKIGNASEMDEFFFIEKDFESTTSKEEDSRYLHDRFKNLHSVLKNSLDDSFKHGESYVGHPLSLGTKKWTNYKWLSFVRKETYQTKYDSIQFKVSLTSKDDLAVMIWLDGKANFTRKRVLNKIKEKEEDFFKILGNIPSSYYIGIQDGGDGNNQKIPVGEISQEFVNKIKNKLSQKNCEFYIVRYFSREEAIKIETGIKKEIVNIFEKLVPISDFLGINSAIIAHSCFILAQNSDGKYDKDKQYRYANQVPNSGELLNGSKFVIQSRINNESYFVGYGKIGEIKEIQDQDEKGKSIKKFEAKFSEYHKFNQSILCTREIFEEMRSNGNMTPPILPITRQLYAKITGDIQDRTSKNSEFANILLRKKQLIFYGPPGTGKTYSAIKLAKEIVAQNSSSSTLTFKEAAIKILQKENKDMHYKEMLDKILEQGLIQTLSKKPDRTLSYTLSTDIQKNGESSIFKRVDNGTYSLNPNIDLEELKETEHYKHQFIRNVTFHQSYSYEEFVEGIKPNSIDGKVVYGIEPGIFRIICEEAEADPDNRYVMIIDEINRGNISKIFGELITLIEKDKRGKYELQLAYSKETFKIPENIHIIGTMNTADRSLIQIDAALRRRFAFCELLPKPQLLSKSIQGISLQKLLEEINRRIVKSGLREKQVGHSYLMGIDNLEDLQFAFANEIVPLLQDYFFDDYKKLKDDILSSDFVDSENMIIKDSWKQNSQIFLEALKKIH